MGRAVEAMARTYDVFRINAWNTMIRTCISWSDPTEMDEFIKWLRGRKYKDEMFWAFISVDTFHKLEHMKLPVKLHKTKEYLSKSTLLNNLGPPLSRGLLGYILRETDNGFGGVCFVVTRHVRNDLVYLLDELPGERVK